MAGVAARAQEAQTAARSLSGLSTQQKNDALATIRTRLEARGEEIIAANGRDVERAESEGLAAPLLKRLRFGEKKLGSVLESVDGVRELPDPTGRALRRTELDDGLVLEQRSCPIGVIGMIFESRPDALVQIATLCLKSGNAVLLKGGSEAAETNAVLAEAIAEGAREAGIPEGWIQLVETREDVQTMLGLDDRIDLVVPRGSKEFVKSIMDKTHIPVLGHADGVCHTYVDSPVDIDLAVPVTVDSKTQYVAVCNAIETLLVHSEVADTFLPRAAEALEQAGVTLRGCERSREYLPQIEAAGEEDWSTEYLDLILSVKIVDSVEEAIEHVNTYGSRHTDAILTEDEHHADQFMESVDAASVMWNCSTRFADGYRYGLGAEVGISTSKLHARGPVGLEGLVTYKWRLRGKGHIVSDYAEGKRHFTHRSLEN